MNMGLSSYLPMSLTNENQLGKIRKYICIVSAISSNYKKYEMFRFGKDLLVRSNHACNVAPLH